MLREVLVVTTAIILVLGIAGGASAAELIFQGTIENKTGAYKRNPSTMTGVATVNGSGGGGFLSTLRIPGGNQASKFLPVTDPEVTATIKSIGAIRTTLPGTIGGLQDTVQTGAWALRGVSRLCLFVANCASYFDIPLTRNDAHTGVGVGGLLTAGGFGNIRVSIEAAPWTLGSGSAINQTRGGNFKTLVVSGFIHGAGSSPGSTAANSGFIQLISPMQVATMGAGDNNKMQSLFSFATLRFIPEPGFLLLMGAGTVGLCILGRSRLRR
jgi:hypothetical protein